MRVLHVIPSVSEKHGGPSYAIKSLARASQAAGISVVIATTDDDGDAARLPIARGVLTERDGVPHIFFQRNFLPYKISFGLRRWLNNHAGDFDLVHIHALFSFSSLVAARAARRHHVPYIIRPLGVLNRWGMDNRRPLLKRLWLQIVELPVLRNAAAIHYTTEAEQLEATSIHADLKRVPAFIIPIPVESLAGGDSSEFGRRFPSSKGKRLILFISRLDEKKGLEALLKSFALVKQHVTNTLLVIAGDGDPNYVERLRRLAAKLGIADELVWTGFLAGGDKAAVFASAAVFVLPSHSENFGIVVAEALAAGVPTVITKGVGISEYIEKYDAGLIVSSDANELASGIRRLLEDVVCAEKFRQNGRRLATEQFSQGGVAAQLQALYRFAVERHERK